MRPYGWLRGRWKQEKKSLLDGIATIAVLQDERPVLKRNRKRIKPHLLRHSAASWWLDAGIHIGDVAGQLGHASLSTTTRFVDRAPNHRRESFRRAGVDKVGLEALICGRVCRVFLAGEKP
jgi:integrase